MYEKESGILLVDDTSTDLELMSKAIKTVVSDKIHVAKDGEEALEYLFSNNEYVRNPKVIFLDLKMPKVSGIEVLSRIKNNVKTKLIPVVIVSSSAELQDLIQCYDHGANSYIVKPIDYNNFLNTISKAATYWLSLNVGSGN